MLSVEAFDHIVLNVVDLAVAAAWYERVLGMTVETHTPRSGGAARTSLRFGRNKINLRPIAATQAEWFTGDHPQPGSDDLCFLTTVAPNDVAAHFRVCGVSIELGPVVKQGALGDICSVYVRDPDGNLIEISSYQQP
jgi:catechol 2,3-dioxygenase-like lactoylglutathione lyase family enzyme